MKLDALMLLKYV